MIYNRAGSLPSPNNKRRYNLWFRSLHPMVRSRFPTREQWKSLSCGTKKLLISEFDAASKIAFILVKDGHQISEMFLENEVWTQSRNGHAARGVDSVIVSTSPEGDLTTTAVQATRASYVKNVDRVQSLKQEDATATVKSLYQKLYVNPVPIEQSIDVDYWLVVYAGSDAAYEKLIAFYAKKPSYEFSNVLILKCI